MKQFLAKYGFGYVVAVLVAVITTEALYITPTILPDQGRYGSFFNTLSEMTGIFLVGMLYTAVTALPGYSLTVLLAAHNGWHSGLYYCLGGALTALLAHLLLATIMRGVNLEPYLVLGCSVPGGIMGAFAYYLWQRRFLSARTT